MSVQDNTENQVAAPSADQPAPAAAAPVAEVDDSSMTPGQWARLAVLGLLLVWLTVATGIYGLVMVLGIVVMITLHELGHFVMARRAGMKCTEFFLGFGPRIWSMQRGETEYGIKLIPAGAYVKIIGMHDIEDVDPADEPFTYRRQPFWQRFGVAVAGSTVHFILALILIYGLLVGFGVPGGSISPDEDQWRVGNITAGSAADEAGLQEGDDLIAIDGNPVATFDEVRDTVSSQPGEDMVLTVERGGEEIDLDATIGRRPDDRSAGFLGIGSVVPNERLSPIEGVPATFREFGSVAVLSVKGLGSFFTPSGISDYSRQVRDARDEPAPVDEPSTTTPSSSSSSTTSPSAEEEPDGSNRLLSLLGVFRIGTEAGEAGGAANLFMLFAFINIFIGLFNLLPLMPFDGGHVVIAVYEKLQEWRRRDGQRYLADVGKLIPMTYAVVAILGLIFVSSLYLDIVNPIGVG